VPLGIVEVGLGATLVLTSGESGSVSTWLASAWALLGGVVLISDALVSPPAAPICGTLPR
jgi:hypothetical protein